MKRIILISSLVATALLAPTGEVQAQGSIEQVLKSIETNNRELQANAQLIASQKLEARTANNLPDPTLSYAHLWGAKEKKTIGELVVAQSFDFPSLYATRNKLNRLKAGAYDSQADVFRQEKLLQAKELCLDIIMLRQQKSLLEERLRNAEELAGMYAKRLQTGDANAIETNKINLELLNIRTETSLNETALRNKLQELNVLNGNLPVVFEENQYAAVPFPADFQSLKSEVIAADRTLTALAGESLVARKQIAVSRSQWLPKLELGYRRNTETGTPFNGLVVGFSFPIFENRNQVKIAKAQALGTDLQKENATLQVASELTQLYEEAKTLHDSMEAYSKTFRSQQDLALLKKALTGGEISMIEYFVEVSVIYQSHQNYLQLENQYQKAMARIYKNKL
ncbi:TolC family protein [uncultured Bacteroides sp.]|uniref:TolC family protein n=1 Tax=uncultured Bacteroides sp. TaxID=162156 RepID=UPI0025DC31EA|nr:TolC family protein [uncultured Bacteroides sp.]